MSALLVGGASTFVSCKDYDEDQTAVNNAELAKLQTSVTENYQKLDAAIKALETAVDGKLDGKQDKLAQDIIDDLAKLHQAIADATDAEAWVNTNRDLQRLKTKVDALITLADNSGALADLATKKEVLEQLANWKSTWGKDLEDIVVKADLADYVKAEDLPDWESLKAIYEKKEDMNEDVEHIIDSITGEHSKNYTSYAALVEAFEGVPERLQAVEKQLDQLLAWQKAVNVTLENTITGVNVDMVENPYFGTLNTPFGVKSTMLIGFVGHQHDNIDNFPGGNIPGGVFTSEDGGSIYFTVNPSEVNMEGVKFALVSRDGTEAPAFALAGLTKDNTKVTTRAAVNGYKAIAGIDPAKAEEAMVNVNKEDLKKVAKNVLGKLKGQESLDVTNAVKTIYSSFKNAIPEYYALQAEYNIMEKVGEDAEGNAIYDEVKRHYTSDFNIAAVTVRPLGYKSFGGLSYHIKSIPQLQEILGIDLAEFNFTWEDLGHMDNITKSITVEIPDADKKPIINGVPAPDVDVDDSKLEIVKDEDGTEHIVVGEGFVKVGEIDFSNATVTFSKKKEVYEITVEMDQFNTMIDKINDQVGGMLGNVQDLLDKAQGGFDKVNNGVIARLNSVIAKVNKLTENPSILLQPVMFYNDVKGNVGRMSESELAPTRLNLNGQSEGSIILVPTSYTAEMLAPAYKKYVACEEDASAIKQDGKFYTFTAKAPGFYTINYSALDYDGNVENKTYYIEVK